MWVIVVKASEQNKYLYKPTSSKSLSITTDKNKAFRFDSNEAALHYINNCIARADRSKYTTKFVEINVNSSLGHLSSFEFLDVASKETLVSIQRMQELIDKLPAYIKQLEDQQFTLERALTDFNHYAEFHDLNVVDGYHLYKKVQELLKLRRRVKNEKAEAEILMRDVVSKQISFKGYLDYIDSLENRKYTPRVLSDLFED